MSPHTRTPTDRFYEPGRRFLRWLEQAGLGRDHPLAYFSAPVMVAVSWVWFVVDATALSTIAIAAAVVFQAITSYLSGADTLARRDVHQEVWSRIKTLNTDTMGHMAILLRYYRERFEADPGMDAVEFRVGMTHLQQHLLRHLVDVIAEHIGLSERKYELSANWAMPERDERGQWFRPRVYDRNMPDRQPFPFRRYPIEGHAVGAAQAFLTGELAFVPDTAAPEAAEPLHPGLPRQQRRPGGWRRQRRCPPSASAHDGPRVPHPPHRLRDRSLRVVQGNRLCPTPRLRTIAINGNRTPATAASPAS